MCIAKAAFPSFDALRIPYLHQNSAREVRHCTKVVTDVAAWTLTMLFLSTFCKFTICLELQAEYSLKDRKALAKFLEDADIRLIRAECPCMSSQRELLVSAAIVVA